MAKAKVVLTVRMDPDDYDAVSVAAGLLHDSLSAFAARELTRAALALIKRRDEEDDAASTTNEPEPIPEGER